MSSDTGVRVESQTEATPLSENTKDYSFLLTENLELLRKLEGIHSDIRETHQKAEKALEAQHQAERALQEEKEKHKAPGGYRRGRRLILGLHVLLSVISLTIGPVLWYKQLASERACLLVIPSIVWLFLTSMVIFMLAEEEDRNFR